MKRKPRIAILSLNYLIQYSPSVRNMANFFARSGINTTIIVDEIKSDVERELPKVKIVRLIPEKISVVRNLICGAFVRIPYLGRYILSGVNILYSFMSAPTIFYRLEKIVNNYDYVICVEIKALDTLSKSEFPLNKAIFFSLELEQYISQYVLNDVKKLVRGCAFCIIQNAERGRNFSKLIGTKLSYEYYPVSIPPLNINTKKRKTNHLEIVYSGSITEWSYLLDFVKVIKQFPDDNSINVSIFGRVLGPRKYIDQITEVIKNDKRFTVDTSYKTDIELLKHLKNADIGLALYKKPNNEKNWDNLITSSGKIAFYSWSGLGILTNLKESGTQDPPFLYVKDVDKHDVEMVLHIFNKKREMYGEKSTDLAKKKYNSNVYLGNILKRIQTHEI